MIKQEDWQAAEELALEMHWTHAIRWLSQELDIGVIRAYELAKRLAHNNPKSSLAASWSSFSVETSCAT